MIHQTHPHENCTLFNGIKDMAVQVNTAVRLIILVSQGKCTTDDQLCESGYLLLLETRWFRSMDKCTKQP